MTFVWATGDPGPAPGAYVVVHEFNSARYPDQRILVVSCDRYAYLVPYVENGDHMLLKTVIPSQKATRDYLGDRSNGGEL